MKSAYVFLADGFEDVEAVTPIDYLRRAGVQVTVVGLSGKTATSSHALSVGCDAALSGVATKPLPDLAVLPGGGKGSEALAASKELRSFISRMFADNRLVGAICAAPAVVLGGWGMLAGRAFTCYPGCEDGLSARPSDKRVVADRNLITSRGPGTAEEFSLELVRHLCGNDVAMKVSSGILAR